LTDVIKDITEDFVYDLSVASEVSQNYQLFAEAYDVAINSHPFFIASNDETPYRRESAQYKREQIDQTTEPGEQSFTGWWFRSQSSFHLGAGARFFEPVQDENLRFRFNTSEGVDIWTRGQVTLLKNTLEAFTSANKSLVIGANDGTNDCGLIANTDDLYKITFSGDTGTLATYSLVTGHAGDNFQSLTTDGTRYFAACDEAIHRGNIGGSTGDEAIYDISSSTTAVVRYVKQRLFAGVDNILYELNPNIAGGGNHTGAALPTGHYTHPNSDWVWTDISESGSAIYAAGYANNNSAIFKVTVNPDDATLNPAIVTAELPVGEQVFALYQYLGYMMIGTSKGMRVAVVNADTGDLSYGPLIFEATQGVRGFTAQDRFVWATAGPNSKTGLIRVDLSEQISPLRFAYAADLQASSTSTTLDVTLIGNRLFFSTDDDGVYMESASVLVPSGKLRTGFIRYATLESKYFKYLKVRGDLDAGSINVTSIDDRGTAVFLYNLVNDTLNIDQGIGRPSGSQEFIAIEFGLQRDLVDNTKGAVMNGYQTKALPAIEKQRLIQFPLYCYDVEMDRYNNLVGSEDDRAYERITALEELEATGNSVTVQDFRTGETFQALIEEIRFMSMTPPNARFDGFGGRLSVTVRKL
jgi:hypothetical protein